MAESSQEGGQQPRPHQSRKDSETQWSSTLGDAYTARVGMSGSCVRPLGLPTLQSSSPPWGGISDPPDVSLQDTACSQTMGLSSGLPLSPAPTWPEQRKDREMSLNKGVGTKEGKRKEQREEEERKGSQEKLEGGGETRKERKKVQLIQGITQMQEHQDTGIAPAPQRLGSHCLSPPASSALEPVCSQRRANSPGSPFRQRLVSFLPIASC